VRLFILLLTSFWLHTAIAEVVNVKVGSFSEIDSLSQHEKLDPAKTLLVFDIDNTLLTMSQPLGGVGWWDWQSDLLKNHPDSKQLVAHNLQDLSMVENLLFQIIKMNPTDQYVIPFIKRASEQGFSLMGLSARGSEHISVTLIQLTENGLVDKEHQQIFYTKGLRLNNHHTSSAGSLDCSFFSRYVTYYQGIVFLSGQDKGKALRCILAKSERAYNTILFVDDAQHNIELVDKVFSSQKNVKVYNVLYTREHAKEQMFLHSKALQAQTAEQWKNIKAAFESNIQHLPRWASGKLTGF